MPAREVETATRTRLERAAAEVADTHAAWQDAKVRRDRLVVTAVDAGWSQRSVGKAAGLSVGRVSALLVESQPDDEG